MARFEIEDSTGKYEIEAPDENSAMQAFQSMNSPQTSSAGAFGRTLLQGGTLGFSDELRGIGGGISNLAQGKPFGEGYQESRDAERQYLEQANREHPYASTAGDIAGIGASLLLPGAAIGAIGKGATQAAKGLVNAGGNIGSRITGGSSLGRSIGQGAVVGSGYGAVEGLGRSEANNISDAAQDIGSGAAFGAVGGGAGGALGDAVSNVINKIGQRGIQKTANKAAAGAEDFIQRNREIADEAYSAARNSGVVYDKSMSNRIFNEFNDVLENEGFLRGTSPKISSVLSETKRLANQGVELTPARLDNLRKTIGNVSADPAEQRLAGILRNKLDDIVENPRSSNVKSGNAAEIGEQLKEARSAYSKSKVIQDITKALENAKLGAGTTGSGGNSINRQAQALLSLSNRKGFTQSQREALRAASQIPSENTTLRVASKLAPSTSGLNSSLLTGASVLAGTPYPIVAQIVGALSKGTLERKQQNSINRLIQSVMTGEKYNNKIPDVLPKDVRDLIKNYLSRAGGSGSN